MPYDKYLRWPVMITGISMVALLIIKVAYFVSFTGFSESLSDTGHYLAMVSLWVSGRVAALSVIDILITRVRRAPVKRALLMPAFIILEYLVSAIILSATGGGNVAYMLIAATSALLMIYIARGKYFEIRDVFRARSASTIL